MNSSLEAGCIQFNYYRELKILSLPLKITYHYELKNFALLEADYLQIK